MKRLLVLASASAACSFLGLVLAPSSTETAVANGDTRTIHFYHTHTGESIDATFRVDGHYDQAVLDKLNYFLRDWRNNDQIHMDPRLFDVLWEVYRAAGAGDTPIQIYSAYRSPETNAMLRRRSRAVAEHSQHMLGKAMDTTMPGMSMEKIREIAMKLQRGGVGYYQSANFVHIDVGGVRSWPRMNYDQLARLFPDGKTVHIASNGQTLPGYEEARAEIAARGSEAPPAQQSQGFFAWLFGASPQPAQTTATPVRPEATALAYANNTEGDEASVASGGRAAAPVQPAPVAQAAPAPVAQQPQARQAVASAEPTAPTEAAGFSGGVIPVPPHRPETLALDDALPLPPLRPTTALKIQLASAEAALPTPSARPATVPDAIGGLISTTAGAPALRKATLPALVTRARSESRGLPGPALAFAATEAPDEVPGSAHEAISRVTGVPGRAITGLRSARHATRMASAVALTAAKGEAPATLDGPAIYGLRRAARIQAADAGL